jgi:hypothetical protein
LDGFCIDGYSLGYQRVEAGCFDTGGVDEVSRGFISFDTRAIPAGAAVQSASLHMCRMGAPGYVDPQLLDTSFPLNLSCATAWGAPVSGPLRSIPRGNGPIALTLPTSSIDPAGHTQYQIRYPITDCGTDNWMAQRYVSSTGPAGGSCPGSTPQRLDVVWCAEPY